MKTEKYNLVSTKTRVIIKGITIDESAKEDFKQMMGWDERNFQYNTCLIKEQGEFEKIMYMKFGDINLAGGTWNSLFQEKMKQYKFKKEDLVILHISIPEDNIVRLVNIEPITQEGIRQIVKDADKTKIEEKMINPEKLPKEFWETEGDLDEAWEKLREAKELTK
jgi:hypothetical protein